MKTRLLSALMTLALVLSLLPATPATAVEEDYTFTNLVVLCKFAGEDEFVNDTYQNATVKQIVDNTYVQSDYSVADYFRAVSGGKMRMQTLYLLDKDGKSLTLTNSREHYAQPGATVGALAADWGEAVNAAIREGAVPVDGNGTPHSFEELDRDKNGTIDLITILYCPTTQNISVSHGDPLWNYQTVSNRVEVSLGNGEKLTSYQYVQATASYTSALYRSDKGPMMATGMLCHETMHALGPKDLYRNSSDTKVGYLSLMGKHTAPFGQYITVKERESLGWLNQGQLLTMERDGAYTLNLASASESVVGYKCQLNDEKTLYLEYRRFDEKGNCYDDQTKAIYNYKDEEPLKNISIQSGLICYWAKTDVRFPNNLSGIGVEMDVESAGQYDTNTDAALGKDGTKEIWGKGEWVAITVTDMTDTTLTFTISGLPETTTPAPEPDPDPAPERTPHQVTFPKPTLTAVYGDTSPGQTAACSTAALTYSSSDPEVAAVDPQTGVLTLRKPGSATITATAPADESHTGSSASYALTVSAKPLSLNGLRAVGRPYEAGKTDVELTGGTLEGIVNSDDVSFTAQGSLESDAAGDGRSVTVTATLTGADAEKYTLNPVTGLTVTIAAPSAPDPAPDPNPDPAPAPNPGLSGGGGGGGMAEPTYKITVKKAQNGKVTPSTKSAAEGEEVTLTVRPAQGYRLDALTVSTPSTAALPLTAGDGTYTFLMPAEAVTVQAAFVDENQPENPEEDQKEELFEVVFKDVPADSYFAPAVAWAVKNGITTGVTTEEFAPGRPCTRGEIVTFLYRAAGEPEIVGMSGFADVLPDSYCARAVAWAVKNGITTGVTAEEFAPDRPCTRAESVTFLYRAAGKPKITENAGFSDVSAENYYASAVTWARQNAITDGVGGGLFGAEKGCTRGEIVTFLFRGAQVN